ncbi:MAG TPA: hypothetical protein VMR44_02510, partial [Thermoanaerobaculia bacterium]|nr:hypothetical protein [Thermoanaerobaculia bacterium]
MERPRHLLAPAALLLLAAAFALPLPDAPLGDEATHLLAAGSLWHDGDLRFDREDLARGYQTWSSGPRGVALVSVTAGAGDAPGVPAAAPALVYGRPFLYPLVAAPVYGLLGPRGLRALNLALYLAMLWLAWSRFVPADGAIASTGHPGTPAVRELRGRWAAGLVVAGLFFASGAAIRTLRFEPEVLLMACVFFAVALWCRVRSEPLWGWRELVPVAAAGVLLAAAAVSEPLLALFALPPAVDLYWARRRRASAVFVLVLIVAGLILAGTQRRITGSWGPELAAEARAFVGPFPLEARPAVEQSDLGPPPWKLSAEAEPALEDPDREPAPRVASAPEAARARPPAGLRLRQAGWRLFWLGTGRHIGLLPYFPFALFVLGLYLADLRRPGGRSRHLLAGAFVVYLAAASLGVAGGFAAAAAPGAAGVSATGARALALVCPVLLFLPWSLRGGRALLLPIAAAGLWTLPAVVVAASGLASDDLLELPARAPAYRVLPLELELLAAGRLPGQVAFARFPEAQGGLW